jgi:hypothetical protein
MANRTTDGKSEHDDAIAAAKSIYLQHGRNVWINPGSEKNKTWNDQYIDVVVTEKIDSDQAWVIEVETEDSVSETEAINQWKDYDKSFEERWYLAVPAGSEADAEGLLKKQNLLHCTVITWKKNSNGTHTFWGLPGLRKQ